MLVLGKLSPMDSVMCHVIIKDMPQIIWPVATIFIFKGSPQSSFVINIIPLNWTGQYLIEICSQIVEWRINSCSLLLVVSTPFIIFISKSSLTRTESIRITVLFFVLLKGNHIIVTILWQKIMHFNALAIKSILSQISFSENKDKTTTITTTLQKHYYPCWNFYLLQDFVSHFNQLRMKTFECLVKI